MTATSLLASCTVAVDECNDTNSVSVAASPTSGWILLAVLVLAVVLGVVLWLRHRNADRRPRR